MARLIAVGATEREKQRRAHSSRVHTHVRAHHTATHNLARRRDGSAAEREVLYPAASHRPAACDCAAMRAVRAQFRAASCHVMLRGLGRGWTRRRHGPRCRREPVRSCKSSGWPSSMVRGQSHGTNRTSCSPVAGLTERSTRVPTWPWVLAFAHISRTASSPPSQRLSACCHTPSAPAGAPGHSSSTAVIRE